MLELILKIRKKLKGWEDFQDRVILRKKVQDKMRCNYCKNILLYCI